MTPPPEIIKSSTKLAILIPTVRWNNRAKALLASTIGIANEEIAVLIGDNSENDEKKEFLNKLHNINNNVIPVSHEKNIGALNNFFFLFDWCKDIEFVAIIGDDDWMTPCYFPNAGEILKKNPHINCCEAGTTLADFGDGQCVNISQPSMTGETMLQRLVYWSPVNARATMYNTSRRNSIQAAIDFWRKTPLQGWNLIEDLWEISRLATGGFLRIASQSYFIHYPMNASKQGDQTQRYFDLLCSDVGLTLPALSFMDLSTAIQCGLFLIGRLSPISNQAERIICSQEVFRKVYTQHFLPKFNEQNRRHQILSTINNDILKKQIEYFISPPYSINPIFNKEIVNLFISIIENFQTKNQSSPLHEKLNNFFSEIVDWDVFSEIADSGVYSKEWNETAYLRANQDVANATRQGFIKTGMSQVAISKTIDFPVDWNETFYLNSNPDVAAAINSGRFSSGYEHFLRFGSKEGRKISSSKPSSINDLNLRVNHNSKVAVVVHLYYIDLWTEIASYLELFPESFDLFVSLVDAVDLRFVSQDILNIYPLANIFLCENRGRDVAPFITLLNSGLLDPYDAVCKIHTKRSKHSQFGDEWRKDCFDRLMGNKNSIERYIHCIRNSNVGLIGPVGYLIADHQPLTKTNKEFILQIIERLKIVNSFGCFFAGTMFWLKPSALKPIVELGLTLNDFEVESGQLDSTLAHGLERVFALVVMNQGYLVSDTDEPNVAIDQNYNKALSETLKSIFDEQKEKQINQYISVREKNAYEKWINTHSIFSEQDNFSQDIQQKTIHIVTYVEPNQLCFLADSLDSLSVQTYDGWKLSVISTLPCPDPVFDDFDNLQWIQINSEHRAMDCINKIVQEVDAEWLCILQAGVILEASSVFIFIRYIELYKEFRLIYTDDDRIDNKGVRWGPQFKPDFNIDLIRSFFYVGDSFLIEKNAFLNVGGLTEYPGTYDLVLRVLDGYGEKSIGHVGDILFHYPENYIGWKKNDGKEALKNHFLRNGMAVNIHSGYLDSTYNIEYLGRDSPLVTIIVPTKDRIDLLKPCLDSLLAKSTYKNYEVIIVNNQSEQRETLDYFEKLQSEYSNRVRVFDYDKSYNYSAINNAAAKLSNGDFLLLLNNDTVIIQPNWLERMLNFGQRNDVGIVGARLVFPNQTIQHAGVILGMGAFGVADHPHIGLPLTEPGYMNRAQVVQNFSAVTAACMLIRKSVYFEVGGLDEENFKVLFNDVDLCLKVRAIGYKIVWTPYATVVHHGSSSIKADRNPDKAKRARQEADKMLEKWLPQLANDPAYNRNLSLKHRQFQVETETDVTWNVDFHDRPRVYAFPANDSGVGEYRVRSPLRALTHAAKIQSSLLPNHSETLIPDIVEIERAKPDVLLLQNGTASYLLHAWEQYRKFNDVFMVYSQDDLIYMLPGKHPLQGKWPKDLRKRLRKLLEHSDRLIVATEPLKIEYSRWISDVKIVPNYLEKAKWLDLAVNAKPRDGKKMRVGWAGGAQHQGDLEFILPVVEATKNEVDWIFMGMCPEQIRPFIKEYHAGVHFDLYPQKLVDLDLDLAIAPLEYNNFNMAKTNLRLLEYGVLGWPVVCSDITPYRNAPVTRVSNNVNHWIKAIREKVNEPDALVKEGRVLKQWVLEHYLLEDHLDEWMLAITPS